MNVGFISATGNLGKSTVCLNLIISLLQEYDETMIQAIDADERQETLQDKMELRKQNGLSYCNVIFKSDDIERELQNKEKINIIDFKGHLGEKEALIMSECDLLIVVTNNEADVLKKTKKFVKFLDDFNYKILVNSYTDLGENYDLEQYFGIDKMLKTKIMRRDSYYKNFDGGLTQYDRAVGNGLSKAIYGLFRTKNEINNLRDEIINLLDI